MKVKGWWVVMLVALISLGLGVWVLAAEQPAGKASEPAKSEPPAKAAKTKKINLPKDYRSWTRAKSMVILEKHPLFNPFGGIHHVYVNKKGLEAFKAGKNYPDGAAIVFDLFEAKLDNEAYSEGARKFTAIMIKNSGAYADTGGWGFEMFAGPKMEPQVKDAKTECFECHQQAKERGYVFSQYTK